MIIDIYSSDWKKKLGKKVSIEDFLKKGINDVNNRLFYKYEDQICFDYLISILEEMRGNLFNNCIKKRLISKDATASVFQHSGKVLGFINENASKICNLNDEEFWYDTYQFIIDHFFENYEKCLKESNIGDYYLNIFNRENLKKTIMTEKYSASYRTCEIRFLEEINFKSYDSKEIETIIKYYKLFYNFISKNNNIFKNEPLSINIFFDKNSKNIALKDGTSLELTYKKKDKIIKDFLCNKKRYTLTIKNINLSKDDNIKFKNSVKANYIQSMDAFVVRYVLKHMETISIHDCFMVDYLNTSYLIAIVNEAMNQDFHDININKDNNIFFSIFVLL